MTIWKGNLNFFAFIFGIGNKMIKQGYIFKNLPFYISFVLLNTFPQEKKFKKVVSYLPTLFFSECNLNHTYVFWPMFLRNIEWKKYLCKF